jgi:hypothetical protein
MPLHTAFPIRRRLRSRIGPAICEPDDLVFAANGADIATREALEDAIVVVYLEQTLAYRSPTERAHVKYHHSHELGLEPQSDPLNSTSNR